MKRRIEQTRLAAPFWFYYCLYSLRQCVAQMQSNELPTMLASIKMRQKSSPVPTQRLLRFT
ncbi:MAG: hypothetical protein ABI954_00675 [Pyrinomonadaceae bacterium]